MRESHPRRKSSSSSWLSASLFALSLMASTTIATAQNAGVIEFEAANYAVNEQAASHTVKVKRTGGSDGAVSVNFATSDGTAIAATDSVANDYTPTSGMVVFEEGETEKAITVQIVVPTSETVAEATETFHLTLSNPTGGSVLGSIAATTFTLNDTPLFFAPADQTTPVGTSTSPISFTISDAETPAENLIVTAISNNQTVLPDSGIVVAGSGANRTVALTPVAGQVGAAQVTLFVTDAGGATMSRSFYLRVGNTASATALAITGTTPANSVPDVVLVADDTFTLNYTTAISSWVTNVSFVEIDNPTLINSHGTGSTSDLRTQPGTSGNTVRTLRIRGNDYSTAAGTYGRATITLGFTGSGAPTNTHTFNMRVNPRAVVDNQLLAIPGATSTFDVLANDTIPLTGHTFTLTGVSTPSNGTLAITPDGKYVRYKPTNPSAIQDTFTYTVTVSSSDVFNGYTFTGIGSVRIGGYVVVDSAVSSQHTDIDIDFVGGRWTQNLRTDAFVSGAIQSGASAQTMLDADEGSLFLDPTTKQARPAGALFDVLGVAAGADVWRGPESSGGHRPFIGIANEATDEDFIESYTPPDDPRATSNSAWVRTDLVGFSGPGNFAAFYGGEVTFDTLDGLNSANDSAAGGNPTDTFWGFAGSHAHLSWYFTAPGRYTLTFRSTVKVNGQFITSPDTTFTFDVDHMAGNVRLVENPPLVRTDSITIAEDSGATGIDVLANDSSEADPYEVLSITAVMQGANGTAAITGSSSGVSYSPPPDFNGADSFTYTVTDEHGGSATGKVDVTVTPVNDMPSFVKGSNIQHIGSDGGAESHAGWVTAITDGDAGVDQALTFQVSVVSGASLFTVAPTVSTDGTLSYTLSGEKGIAMLEVSLTDDATTGGAALTTAAQTFSITNAEAPKFTIVGLGTLGGTTSSALDVNNNRQVSGNSLVTSDPGSTGSLLRAYLWSSGTMTNLGFMTPIPPSTSTNRFGRGYAVNDAGVVVGEFNNDSSRAFVYSEGVMSGLTRLAGGTDNGVALDINNSNVIVGSSSNGTASKATKWTYNGTTYVASDLGTIAGTPTATGRAAAINENGAAAGQSTNSAGTTQATLWNGSNIVNITSLGDGTRFSQAFGINESLEVVGSSSTGQTVGELIGTGSSTGITRAFHWKDVIITELPPFNLYTPENNGSTTNYHSTANDINDAGVIVGNSQRIAGMPAVATVWENGVAIDLNTLLPPGSGWVLTNADGINDRGDITGTGTFGGVSRAFLLERRAENDMPSFVKGADIEHIGNNSGAQSFPAWVTAIKDGDVEVEQALTFNVQVTSGASIFAAAPALSANGTLSYTLSGVSGVATLAVSLTDDATAGSDALTTEVQTFIVTSLSTTERQVIAGVHADAIAVFGEAGALTLETMAENESGAEVRLDPNEVVFHVEESTRGTVSYDPAYAFLGAAGSSVWTAPQDNPGDGILWPGFSTEGVPMGMVDDEQITLRLEALSGPGTVHIYQTDAFNVPTRRLSSTGTDYRAWTLATGAHVHANWAFSAAGTYALTFSATGSVNGSHVTVLQTYTFIVGSMPTAVATTTTLTALPQLTVVGNPVQLTANVSPADALGYVEFLAGAELLAQKALSQGSAMIKTTDLPLGTNSVRARFVPVWEHDYATSTSGALSVVVTEPGGLPFGIVGVAASYQAGDTLSAVLSGYTLKQDEQVRWCIRRVGSTSADGTALVTAASLIYNTVIGISHDGYEISAQVRLGSTVIATTDWVPLAVQQHGTAPVMTVANAPDPIYMGDTVLFHLQRGTLAEGETVQLVRRSASGQWSELTTGLSTMPVTYPDADHVAIQFYMGTTITAFDFAIRVMSNGVALRQSAPVPLTLNAYEAAVAGVRPLYRIGQSLTATATLYPLREDVPDLTYAWEFRKGTQPNQVWGQGSGALAPMTHELALEHDGGNLFLFIQRSGSTVASVNVPIRVTSDLAGQAFFFESLASHYHQGDNVNLRLLADPELSTGDQILWEWKWPGAEWTAFTLPTGSQYTTTAEQALSGVQVRATLDFAEAGKASVVANPVTIDVDDHGAAARQKPTIAGATSYNAGSPVTLTRELPTNGPTILTAHHWERKGAGDSSFSTITGQSGSTLSFPATLADNGAEYRVAILKPDGSVAYGPSPAVALSVTASSYVPFSMLASYGGVMGSSANSIGIGDVTGDGIPDMVAVGGSPGTLALIKNGGGGQFLPGVLLNEGSGFYAFGAYLADVDGDGDLDILTGEADIDTMNGDSSNGEVACYVNDGTGTFTRQTLLSGLAALDTYIEVADLNGDGRPDVLHRISDSTVVYRPGLPAGGFGEPVTITDALAPLEYPVAAFQVADKDGDGDQDIFLLDDGVSQLRVFENNGTGSFTQEPGDLPSGLYANIRDVADVTGDGRPDVLIIGFAAGVGYQGMVAVQQADGSFATPTPLLADSAMYAAAVGDFNQDEIPDLVSVIYGGSGYVLRLHIGTGDGEFSAPQTLLPQLWYPNDLKIQDLDGNGSPDIAVAVSSDQNPVYVLLNSAGSDPRQVLPPAGRVYTEGDRLELCLYFGSPAMVTGTPRVALQVGTSTVYADYVSGSGTPTLLFRYTVAAADLDLDGVQLVTGTAMDLNGGSLLDHSGNTFSLEIPATPFNGVIVNGSSPLVASITRADHTPTNAPTLRFNVLFTEAVEGVEATDFELVQGGEAFEGAAIQSVTGAGSSYQVTVASGTGSGVLGLHVKAAASITATSGAPFSKGYQGGEVYTFRRGPAKTIDAFYTSEHGHADFRPVLEDGLFEFVFVGDHEHGEVEEEHDHGEHLPSDELVTYVGAPALVARAAAASYDFLGVGAGENLHIITSGAKEGVPYLGWSGESVPTGVLARYLNTDPRVNATNAYMKVQLAAVRSTSDGEFSIYSISSGNPRVWMATSDGISNTDAFFLRPGSHSHLNVGFSKPGIYEVDVFVSAYRDTNGNGTYDEVKDPYIEGGIQTMIYAVDPEGGMTPVVFAADMAGLTPVAVADSFSFGAGESYTGNVLSNDTDPQGDELITLIKTQAAQGTVTLAADGSFTYEPHVFGIRVTDSFAYYAHDSKGGWAEATVALNISALAPQEPMQPGEVVDLAVSLPEGSKATVRGLPPGLKYNAKTNTITGRARTQGSYLISIQVKDADGNVSAMLVPLVVKGLPTDIVGKFVGYLSGQLSGSLQERSGGRVDLTVTALGSYSLKVTHGATTTSQSGYLDVTEELPKIQVALRSGFDLTMSLASGTLSGTATLADIDIPVTGWRAAYDAKLNPAVEQQGYYTVALVQSSTATGHPQGHGFLAVKIGADGKTTVTGKAADGISITSTAFLGADNKVLVHTPLYSKKGATIGALDLTLDDTGSYMENELEGTLIWSKPAILTGRSSQESDFALPLAAYGRYMGVDTKNLIMGLPTPGALTQLHFDSPALAGMSPDVIGIELLYPSIKCLVPVNPARTTLKVTKTTGAISGGFTLVDDRTKRAGKFQGMVVRDDTGILHAVGYTLLPMLPEVGQSAAKTQIVSGAVEWKTE